MNVCKMPAVVLLLLLLPLGAFAQAEPVSRGAAGRDRGSDRFVAGATVSVTRPVAGDLFAAGGDVDVSADVGGDAVVAGGNVRLGNAVGHGLYAAGGRVAVHGPVRRNARIAGGSVEIGPRGSVAGNVTIGGGDVALRGAIDGYLQVGGGHVLIDGSVGGDVEVGGGTVELGPMARINGRLRYASRDELRHDPAAVVTGGIERVAPPAARPGRFGGNERVGRAGGWVWSIGLLVVAALLAALLPRQCSAVGATVRERWPLALLVGFVALAAIPAAALVALLTVVGIPIALATVALYGVLLLIGYAAAGIAAGAIALAQFRPERAAQAGWRVGAAVLGMLALTLLGRVPWLGAGVVFAALLLGVGATLLQARSARTAPGG